MDTLQAARSWVRNGFSIIPIGWRSKRPAFDALKSTRSIGDDGAPAWEAFKSRHPSDQELVRWFTGPQRNLGVVTGWAGLVVLDFDNRDAYTAWQSWAEREGGQAAAMSARTYRVYSSRGVHVYLIVEEPVDSFKAAGVDVKARWGYVLAPPSIHPCGHEYTGEGSVIARCKRLEDVFPFGRMEPEAVIQAPAPTSDPYEAASRAVMCGGDGSVMAAKARLTVGDLVTITHRDRGGGWALCPLHQDHNPSFRVYADGRWKCFGCGRHGDAVDLYAALHGMTNREAIATLAGVRP